MPTYGARIWGYDVDMNTDPKTGKPHLEFFRVGDAGWVEIAPGVQQKVLAGGLDEANKRGFLNRLVRWAPGAAIEAVIVQAAAGARLPQVEVTLKLLLFAAAEPIEIGLPPVLVSVFRMA